MSVASEYLKTVKRLIAEHKKSMTRWERKDEEDVVSTLLNCVLRKATDCHHFDQTFRSCEGAVLTRFEQLPDGIGYDFTVAGMRFSGEFHTYPLEFYAVAKQALSLRASKKGEAKEQCIELCYLTQFLSVEKIERFTRYVAAIYGDDPPANIPTLVAQFIESEREYQCPYERA